MCTCLPALEKALITDGTLKAWWRSTHNLDWDGFFSQRSAKSIIHKVNAVIQDSFPSRTLIVGQTYKIFRISAKHFRDYFYFTVAVFTRNVQEGTCGKTDLIRKPSVWNMALIPCLVPCTVLTRTYYVNKTQAVTLSPPFSHLSSLKTSWVMLRPTAALVKVYVVLCWKISLQHWV